MDCVTDHLFPLACESSANLGVIEILDAKVDVLLEEVVEKGEQACVVDDATCFVD
jgi:hypothetical protein